MSNEMMSLKIDDKMVQSIVAKHVQSAVVAQLGNPEAIISRAVEAALSEKVNVNGERGQYNSDNRYDIIEVLCNKAIRDVASEVMREWVRDNSETVKAAIRKEMMKPKFHKTFVDTFIQNVTERSTGVLSYKINLSPVSR